MFLSSRDVQNGYTNFTALLQNLKSLSMWKHIAGVSNPNEKKRKLTTEEKQLANKEYEKNKRPNRKYSDAWKKYRPWLKDTENGMVCTACKESKLNPSQAFSVGCKTYKLDSVCKHEKSTLHEKAVLMAKAKLQSKERSNAAKLVMAIHKDTFPSSKKMFRTCHALIMKNRPISDFNWQCDLDEMKGIQLDMKFIGVYSPEKPTAENIVAGLQDLVAANLQTEWHKLTKKLLALSCNGANVMVGCRAGVGALLWQDQPCNVTLNCMAYRLELQDATKKVKLYNDVINTLAMGLYYFYHNSSVNRSMLQRSFNALKPAESSRSSSSPLMPTRVGGTCWVGHVLRAVTST